MMRLSSRSKLIAVTLITTMIVLLALTVVTYCKFNKVIETELVVTMTSRTQESANHINTWLVGRLGEVRETVESPVIDQILTINPQLDLWRHDESITLIDELNLSRWRFISSTYPNQYAALHIVSYLEPSEWGNASSLAKLAARYYNVKEGLCKTDLWAKAGAEEAGQRYSQTAGAYDAIFKPAYSQAYDRNIVLILAWRKNQQGKIVAGAAASLTIETVQRIAQQLKYGQKGYGILLAQDGTFVTHPNSDWSMKQKTSTVGDENMRELGELAASGESGMFRFKEGNERKIAFYSPIPVAQWTVVTVVNEDELFVPANTLQNLMQIIIAIIVVFTLLVASSLSYVIHLRRSHAVERRAYLAEISALQAQIQPHFLYNTLNTIVALCRMDPPKAAEMLDELSNYLQGKFRLNSMEMVPLEQELDLINSYLALEQVLFGERLKIVLSIDTDSNPLIPPLILQPLIENAVKHGICHKRKGGTIKISVKKTDNGTVIVVADDGVGIAPEKLESILNNKKAREAGVGLNNINKRLKKHYGYGLDIQSTPNKETIVTVVIPDKRGEYFD